MPDNTNVNANSAVTVVGRTAPVPPGQQKSSKSIPVVIASDQSTIPVAEQNKVQSEVALSLLGIPRSEVALGIFADVNTYDVNPTEWTSTPEQFATVGSTGYTGIGTFGWGLTHVPEESGALVEAPPDKSAILTSKRFFRYQPGRVSSATFGVKTTLIASNGSAVHNPAVRKYGIFDNYDGYYWETRNDGSEDNFCVVRRTQANTFVNPVNYASTGSGLKQQDDYGVTNPYDPLEKRASESVGTGSTSVPTGYTNRVLGDLVIIRDKLMMTHAGVYDESLLQPKHKVGISSIYDSNVIGMVGLANSITNAVYNNDTGLMTITTKTDHGYKNGKYVTLTSIGMTCQYSSTPKYYPDDNTGYNVVRVDSANQFTVNVGVSTVPTFYFSGAGGGGGYVIGLSDGQYISYEKGSNSNVLGGLTDEKIYKVANVGVNTITGISTASLLNLDGTAVVNLTNTAPDVMSAGHSICTPVPFVQPVASNLIGTKKKYTTAKASGMFPYQYTNADNITEGYIKTDRPVDETATIKGEVDAVNNFYRKWVNQNVDIQYWGVYEYRVPRSRFSGDRLDDLTDDLLYSDSVALNRPGDQVTDANTGEILQDTSIWNLEFDKVTMYKIEFSWYGAVGALFLAYVPVSNGEARWVRVHHLRASNQLKVSSLGNATLPITYMVYGGGSSATARYGYNPSLRTDTTFDYGSASEHIIKYGASYYIDGGDRGTVKLFSHGTPQEQEVYGLKRRFAVGVGATQANLTNATDTSDPYIGAGSTSTLSNTYYIGAKVITADPLDQNIEVTYVNPVTNRLHLNSPLNQNNTGNTEITIIPNRVTPLVGIKCRDFIQSSTGRDVRNRTQVYPTRLSTGSDAVIKVDLLKTPLFQTNSVIVKPSVIGGTNGQFSLTSEANIGKRGKPTPVAVPLSTYTGVHVFVPGSSDLTNAVHVETVGTLAITAAAYDSTTGRLTLTSNGHGLTVGAGKIRIKKEGLAFTCDLDNNTAVKVYPRATDPIFDNINDADGTSAGFSGDLTTVAGYSLLADIVAKDTNTFTINIVKDGTNAPSSAEYIRDIDGGAYGYFRGRFESDATNKPISVLGYLENRGKDRTKGVDGDDYYFYALNATTDNIILNTTDPFIREEDADAEGNATAAEPASFTLAQLSSIKVAPQLRSPIPKTGTIVASLFIPASGENYDLSPYFDYNKEYLSFPLTNIVDSLYLCGSTQKEYKPGLLTPASGIATATANVSASLTWEEQ